MENKHDIRLSMTRIGLLQLSCREHELTFWCRVGCWREMLKVRREIANKLKLKIWTDD